MNDLEARAALELMVLPGEDPVLSEGQVADLVARARRPDVAGLVFGDVGYVATWDLDAAAAEGWRRKASFAASRFNFAEDGQRFDRAQVYSHCLVMVEQHARRSMGVLRLGGS